MPAPSEGEPVFRIAQSFGLAAEQSQSVSIGSGRTLIPPSVTVTRAPRSSDCALWCLLKSSTCTNGLFRGEHVFRSLPGCEKLSGKHPRYRIRQGPFRILYKIKDDELIVYVVKVADRRDVYKGVT